MAGQDSQSRGARSLGAGIQAAERLMEHLTVLADRAPLDSATIRDAFATFCEAEQARQSRRLHAFERALVERFEARFDAQDEGRLSRRVVIGLTFALTRLLGADSYRQYESAARSFVAGEVASRDQIGGVVDAALVALARRFDGAFLEELGGFIALINSRLGAPRPGRWDTDWELTRPLAIMMLDDLYAPLRDGHVEAHGDDAAAVLSRFFAGLEHARGLARRPWLRRPLGVAIKS